MHLKKTKKNRKTLSGRTFDKVLLLIFPTALIFLVLTLLGIITVTVAILTLLLSVSIIFFVFRPLLDRLNISVSHHTDNDDTRETFHTAQAFMEFKSGWTMEKNKMLRAQTLSDASILERLTLPIFLINETGKIVRANKAGLSLFKRKPIGKKLFDLFPTFEILSSFGQVLETNTPVKNLDISLDNKLYFKAVLEKLPAKTKNGAVAVLVMTDVTAFKTFEESQRTFFANASHELKTPLSVFSGLIETMQGPAQNDKKAQEEFLSMMATQTAQMTELVQDLLTLCRIGQKNTPLEDLDVADILQTVVGSLIVKADMDKKEIKLNIQEKIPLFIGRKQELFRVFQNLIDNAIKYGRPKTTITVTLKKENKNLYFSVHNWGEPIAKEVLPHICERFYRSATQYSGTGTGLGLSIVQEIINASNGSLRISSTAKKGTLFEVRLPYDILQEKTGFFI